MRAEIDTSGIRTGEEPQPPNQETCSSSLEPIPLRQIARLENATTVQRTTRTCLWQGRTVSLETGSAPRIVWASDSPKPATRRKTQAHLNT
eukprot:5437105-Alexandrium_andersonii.AAC.1